jgi:hypothetical protein
MNIPSLHKRLMYPQNFNSMKLWMIDDNTFSISFDGEDEFVSTNLMMKFIDILKSREITVVDWDDYYSVGCCCYMFIIDAKQKDVFSILKEMPFKSANMKKEQKNGN